jgi:hypothetical protein
MLRQIPAGGVTLADAVWIDLLNATVPERNAVQTDTKVRLPTQAEIEEIESSSRVLWWRKRRVDANPGHGTDVAGYRKSRRRFCGDKRGSARQARPP